MGAVGQLHTYIHFLSLCCERNEVLDTLIGAACSPGFFLFLRRERREFSDSPIGLSVAGSSLNLIVARA